MGMLYNKAKKVYYFLLEKLTAGRGVGVKLNSCKLRLPARWYRSFPKDYENDNFMFFKKNMPANPVVIDIGSHIGLYAVFFAKEFNATVFSFEPAPATRKILNEVVEINNCKDKVFPSSAAISDKAGKAKFFIDTNFAISASNSLVDYNIGDGVQRDGSYEVDLISIDEFAAQKSLKINVLKIDAEGVEVNVLKGAEKTFLEQRPVAILGLHPFAYKNKPETLGEIWDILIKYRMKIFMDGNTITKDKFCNNDWHVFDVQLLPE
jgi:FkbM family methyltransferase